MESIQAIVIRGDFTEEEFADLVAFIRQMDDRRPGAKFAIVGVDPSASILEVAESLLGKAVRELPGRRTDWSFWRR